MSALRTVQARVTSSENFRLGLVIVLCISEFTVAGARKQVFELCDDEWQD